MNMQQAENYSTREKKNQLNVYWTEQSVPVYSYSGVLSVICNVKSSNQGSQNQTKMTPKDILQNLKKCTETQVLSYPISLFPFIVSTELIPGGETSKQLMLIHLFLRFRIRGEPNLLQ